MEGHDRSHQAQVFIQPLDAWFPVSLDSIHAERVPETGAAAKLVAHLAPLPDAQERDRPGVGRRSGPRLE